MLTFAITELKVRDSEYPKGISIVLLCPFIVVVVGHTRCGGVNGAFDGRNNSNAQDTPLVRWLTPLVGLAKQHTLPGEAREVSIDRLVGTPLDRMPKTYLHFHRRVNLSRHRLRISPPRKSSRESGLKTWTLASTDGSITLKRVDSRICMWAATANE